MIQEVVHGEDQVLRRETGFTRGGFMSWREFAPYGNEGCFGHVGYGKPIDDTFANIIYRVWS